MFSKYIKSRREVAVSVVVLVLAAFAVLGLTMLVFGDSGSSRNAVSSVGDSPPRAPDPGGAVPKATSQAPVDPSARIRTETSVPPSMRFTSADEAFAQYRAVSNCLRARDLVKALSFADPVQRAVLQQGADGLDSPTCRKMTSVDERERFTNLLIAVEAGIPGASALYAAEGPFGDPSALETRPDDLLVREWIASALSFLDRDAKRGDLVAIMTLANFHDSDTVFGPRDPEAMFVLLTAYEEILRQRDKRLISADIRSWLLRAKFQTPSANVERAAAKGQAIAKECCSGSRK
jgi:hypothetical protein